MATITELTAACKVLYRLAGMKCFFLFSILMFGLTSNLATETEKSAVYYVSPTETLSSCPGNSSCRPHQLCHTMNYLAEHSSELFSPNNPLPQ